MKILSLFMALFLLMPASAEEGWFHAPDDSRTWFFVGERDLEQMVEELRADFPQSEFEPDSERAGFYASGPDLKLERIARKLGFALKEVTVRLPVREGLEPERAAAILREKFPDVRISVSPPAYNGIWVQGSRGGIEQVKELLSD